jgi:fructose-1-phosphate kinase PfkB-like protein
MTLQTAQLSPSQKSAIEEQVGRQLTAQENIVLCGGTPKVASATDHENAIREMRYRLALCDASQRRLSIADMMDALLGEGGAEVPVQA